uniref:Uncharacterized protein n=1 Tax=Musca domestica TaxID=7370 RepID=A0A1I8NKE1_MUSDO
MYFSCVVEFLFRSFLSQSSYFELLLSGTAQLLLNCFGYGFGGTFTLIKSSACAASSKKSRKSKSRKRTRDAIEPLDDKGIVRKQKELMRVLHVKNFQLQNGNLSYLDYIELREELLRLNALKDIFKNME